MQQSQQIREVRLVLSRKYPTARADVVAVKGDPLKNVSELERVSFVMKPGTVCKP